MMLGCCCVDCVPRGNGWISGYQACLCNPTHTHTHTHTPHCHQYYVLVWCQHSVRLEFCVCQEQQLLSEENGLSGFPFMISLEFLCLYRLTWQPGRWWFMFFAFSPRSVCMGLHVIKGSCCWNVWFFMFCTDVFLDGFLVKIPFWDPRLKSQHEWLHSACHIWIILLTWSMNAPIH